jgi:uncharacterized protein (DUF2336 family)
MTVLAERGPVEVRQALAEALADSPRAPRHVVSSLAVDQASIAVPLVLRSPLFIEAELLELLACAARPVRFALAQRPHLSASLSAAIAESGDGELCLVLLNNSGAEIDTAGYAWIVERHGGDTAIRAALLKRENLPPGVRQSLVKHVADALGEMVAAKSWLSETRAAAVVREAADRATVAIAGASEANSLPGLVEHLRSSGQLTTVLLLRAVCAGNLDFFEAALAALADAPLDRVVDVVSSHRLGALRSIYVNAGLPPSAFDAFTAALDIWSEVAAEADGTSQRTPGEVAEAIVARHAGIAGDAGEIQAILRRFAAEQARDAALEYAQAAA